MPNGNITITGDLGSGKSSVARELCKRLGYKYFSTGNFQRELAQKWGMNTLEMNYHAEKNKEIDQLIDDKLIRLNEESEYYVLDSRLAWHFVKNSFKVYLTVIPEIAAKRVMTDTQRRSEPGADNLSKLLANLQERRKSEDERFKKTYGVNCSDLNNYDVVIDTSNSSVEDISNLIIELYGKRKQGPLVEKFWNKPNTSA